MKILSLQAENIKKLKVIDITPNGFVNRISGPNGSGKTSVLDCIFWVLCGTSAVASQPVRKGAGKGFIRVELDDLIVTRRFYEGGSSNGTLALESKSNRSRYPSPQALLDGLMGKISFDPLEFLRMKPEKQSDVLRSLVKLDIDVDALDAAYQADYLRRREAKKERDALQIRRDAFGVPSGLPKEKVDEAALVAELSKASEYNAGLEKLQRDRDRLIEGVAADEREIASNRSRAEELRAEADNLDRAAMILETELNKTRKAMDKWDALPQPKNATALAEQITEARTTNEGIDRRTRREGYDTEIDALDREITELTTAMDEREATRAKAISEAEFPIPGLAFGDKEVIYEGLPFDQISNADQIRASVAIGMASNPELRVMRIKDGSLLDAKSMKVISEMTHEHDFQVFVEVVDTSGKVGVYMEDGEVKRVNPEPEPEPKAIKPKRKKAAAV
jgi:hypothetical protein